VAIQEKKQLELFSDDPRPDLVVHELLEILKATASEDTQQLESVVPAPEYRNAFLKLSRNLAPTGNTFGAIELREGAGAEGFLSPPRREIRASGPAANAMR
jgi:hypothetical protein